jgi:hypothetical protein
MRKRPNLMTHAGHLACCQTTQQRVDPFDLRTNSRPAPSEVVDQIPPGSEAQAFSLQKKPQQPTWGQLLGKFAFNRLRGAGFFTEFKGIGLCDATAQRPADLLPCCAQHAIHFLATRPNDSDPKAAIDIARNQAHQRELRLGLGLA